MSAAPNSIASWPKEARYKGRAPYWATPEGMRRIKDALDMTHGRTGAAAKLLKCHPNTIRRVVPRMRAEGMALPALQRRRFYRAHGAEPLARVSALHKQALVQLCSMINGDTQEVDVSNCALAKVYGWRGRAYGSVEAHVSRAGPELQR
jgi:hypothetical protein